MPSRPSGDSGGFLVVKGTRDVVMALVLGVLLVAGHRRPLGWVMLVEALAAYGDMADVLAHHGSAATALGVHGLTATLMVVNGLLLMRETRKAPIGVRAVLTDRQVRPDELLRRVAQLRSRHTTRSPASGATARVKPAD
ncbi:DUF4267 domain-containing protein [Streptomyces sp. NPDC001389]|uniref:DUF4267 domain-containing protein n=1 Tax=Streptomyces sp. NPDC001389 TaxID=3364569 RepID=UPI0036C6AA0D